jgi:hypothetical protein
MDSRDNSLAQIEKKILSITELLFKNRKIGMESGKQLQKKTATKIDSCFLLFILFFIKNHTFRNHLDQHFWPVQASLCILPHLLLRVQLLQLRQQLQLAVISPQ